MKRILESEVMETAEEASEYDRMAKLYALFMQYPVANQVLKKLSSSGRGQKQLTVLDVGGAVGELQYVLQRKTNL